MKHLLFALVFSQLAFAQPDIDGIERTLNYPLSLFQLQEDAENGIPEAQYNLALIYDKGTGVPQSYEKSFEWFLKAANSGFDSGQFALGYMYLHGHGRDKNIVEAEKWFLKAALQGHARSQFTLGLIYDVGEGVDRSVGKSYFWHYIAMLNDYLEAPGMVKYMAEIMTAEEINKSKNAAIKCFKSGYQQCEL
jgi:TPR repeat protein